MNINSYWISGFVDSDGYFYVGINKNNTIKVGVQVLPEFTIVQHKREVKILYALKEFFKCGMVKVYNYDRMCYCVKDLKNLNDIIIPFFEKYQLLTSQKYNFIKFRWIVKSMIYKKYHLDKLGLKKIILVKKRMNKKLNKIESIPSRE